MYEAYWQLEEKPFENTPDPRFFYPGAPHQAALLKLRYAIENHRGGALLAGASGLGKTLVVGMLRTVLDDEFAPFVHLVFPQMEADELLGYLAGWLAGGEDLDRLATPAGAVRRIESFLAENTERGRHAVVVVDEAQLLEDRRTLEAMRLLSNFQALGRAGLTLLLVGQAGILPVLDRMPQLEERLAVKCLLRPFTATETSEYVAHRLRTAGAGAREVFTPDALRTLHELTCGIPRRINRLGDLALLIGYAESQSSITAAQIEAVCHELVTVAPE